MEFGFFYGPDKIPFLMDDQEMVLSDSAIPFHGIISRGLLKKFEDEGVNSNTWFKYSHLIGNTAALDQEPDLTQLQEYAHSCEVLSFSNSAVSVRNYAENYINKSNKGKQLTCELWNIKEGHTSSVWKVTVKNKNHFVEDPFIVNVARDQAAGLELKHTSEKMQAIAENFHDINMARVHDIDKVTLNYFDKYIDVVVTRNEFIPRANEIHSITRQGDNNEQYVLVERFLTSETNPSRISSIKGRKFTEDECNKIKMDINFFSINASKDFNAQINIMDGDLVWNGEKAIVVAIN